MMMFLSRGLVGFTAGGNNWPGAEPPEELIDGFFGGGGAKYLNFAELNTGVIITPSTGATVANRMTLWTANDAEPRDPTSYELYGANVEITQGGPGITYSKSDFTLISQGALTLPTDRSTDVDQNIAAEEGSETTTLGPFPNPTPGSPMGFFRVSAN